MIDDDDSSDDEFRVSCSALVSAASHVAFEPFGNLTISYPVLGLRHPEWWYTIEVSISYHFAAILLVLITVATGLRVLVLALKPGWNARKS